jgi:hypothetical protein
LQEPVDPGSGRSIVEAEQVGFVRDLPVQLEVEELANLPMVVTALPVVVHHGREAGTFEPQRYVIENDP